MAAAAAAFADPLFYDKNFMQYFGVRYIRSNLYDDEVATMIHNKIVQLLFGGSDDNPGPRCDCIANENQSKCQDENCLLHENKIECQVGCGAECHNLPFSRPNFPTCLEIQARDGYGIVLVTTELLEEGLPVVEMTGRFQLGVIARNQSKAPHKPNSLYCCPIRRFENNLNIYLNQETEANESRFVAHSCMPNCEIQEWIVGKEIKLMLVAVKNIAPESVLTVCYPQIEHKDDPVVKKTVTEEFAEKSETAGDHKDNLLWESKDRPACGPTSKRVEKPKLKPAKKTDKKPAEKCPKQCQYPRCHFQYETMEQLRAHVEQAHGKDKIYRCYYENCSFRYDTRDEFLDHLEEIHGVRIPPLQNPPPSKKQ